MNNDSIPKTALDILKDVKETVQKPRMSSDLRQGAETVCLDTQKNLRK